MEANNQVKIREFPGDTKSLKLLHVIASIQTLLDATESPSYESKQALVNLLIESYSHLSCEEMVCAVKLNLTGTYGETIQCYNKIDIQYLTKCFNEYNKFKQRAILAHKAVMESEKDKQPILKATPEESYKFIKNYFEQNKMLPHTADWYGCFHHMYYNRMLDVDALKSFMGKEKPKLIEEINAKIKTSSNLVDKRVLELQLEETAVSLHLRKKYIHENAEKLFAA